MTDATILDMCCGSRMFWFDKQDERAVFSDIRAEHTSFATVANWLSARTSLLISVPFHLPITHFQLSYSTHRILSV